MRDAFGIYINDVGLFFSFYVKTSFMYLQSSA